MSRENKLALGIGVVGTIAVLSIRISYNLHNRVEVLENCVLKINEIFEAQYQNAVDKEFINIIEDNL